jgi:hypothetical protein
MVSDMNDPTIVASLAVIASTTTAVVSLIVTSRSQRSAIREQYLWQARTETYLDLQPWIEELYVWFDGSPREAPPAMEPSLRSRVMIFAGPYVRNHFGEMTMAVYEAGKAAANSDWDRLTELQFEIGQGFAIDLQSLLRDDVLGRSNQFALTRDDERLRLRWRHRVLFRWWRFTGRIPTVGGDDEPDGPVGASPV